MQIVIDIDERDYESAKDGHIPFNVLDVIMKGTLLPKGHGRLIDADTFERRCMFDNNIEDMQDVIYALRDYKPIIEADKERSEYKMIN